MKKHLFIMLSVIFLINSFFVPSAMAEEPKLNAKSAILVDMKNPMVLYEKNSNDEIQPSGFTKIVTALVVLENCSDLSQVITAPSETIARCDFSFGNMGILGEENLSVEALLQGMLLYDAAEAAEVLAGFTFGNYVKFIAAMNEIAKKVGAENTHFENAGGYFDEKQKTTVNDIALICQYAMKNDTFANIVNKGMAEIEPTNKYRERRYLANTNMFVGKTRSLDFYTTNVFGVKTASMKGHGYGISVAFKNSKGSFLCVTAGNENSLSAHEDVQKLRKYVSEGFTNVKIAKKGDIIEEVEVPNGRTSHVLLKAEDELSVRLPVDYDESKIFKWTEKNADLRAPIEKDAVLGALKISYDGKNVGSVNLIAYDSVEFSAGKSIKLFFGAIFTSPFFYIPLILFIAYFALSVYKELKSRKTKSK